MLKMLTFVFKFLILNKNLIDLDRKKALSQTILQMTCTTPYLSKVGTGQCYVVQLTMVGASYKGLLGRTNGQTGNDLSLGIRWVSTVTVWGDLVKKSQPYNRNHYQHVKF